MKHPKFIKGYKGSFKELAENICNMRYDHLALFLEELSKKMRKDYEKDKANGKKKLSRELEKTAIALENSKFFIDTAWGICEQYMKEEE